LGTSDLHGGVAPLRAGLDAGARFVDTAESYGSEALVGEALRGRRSSVFVATKVSRNHLRYAEVLAAADRSLKLLGTDYVDLYQLHEPNDDIPLEETLGAMEVLVDAGKIRYVGVSNFSLEQLRRAEVAMARHRIVSNQMRYNPADRTIEAGMLEYCAKRGITVIAYSPLCQGVRFLRDCDPDGLLDELAMQVGRTVAQVALNWALCSEPVVVIPRANTIAHAVENCGASGWRLSPEQRAILDAGLIYRRRSSAEIALRRIMPGGLKRTIRNSIQRLPPGVRRRFN
jgi:diketogulonate reductase-like aldo/keto reductase